MSGEQPDTLGLARAVAESILASPKLDPGLPKHEIPSTVSLSATSATTSSRHRTMTLAKDIASESSLSSTVSSHLSPPTSAFDDLKISDEDDYYDEIDRKDGKAPDACNLFVGDLARTVTEDQLREVFSKQGDVIAVDIKRDKITQNNLGYGFVQFKTRDQAVKAREALHGAEVGGRKIRIGWAQKNTTLFIGDLDGTVTTQQLREIFLKYGPLVEDETFVKAGSGKFGFVRFKHRTDAERAKADMNRKMIGSRPIRIGWGDNNIQKHCVHVQFNPSQGAHLIEAYFRKHFEQFGVVQNVSLPRFANRRLKGYGFIHFQENNEGEKAAGKAIATLAESKVANVTIRCSYGKRQIYNRYRRNPKNYARGGFGVSSSEREPIYSQAWAITMPGGWPPVQPYGSQSTPMGMSGLMGSVSPPGPQGQSPYFMAQPAPDSLGRRFSQDQSSTPIYMHQPTHSPQQTPQTAYYPSLRDTELSPMMYYQQSPASGYSTYPMQGQGQVVFDDLSLAHTEAAQAYFKQAMAATGQQMKSEQGLGSLGGLTTAPLSVPSSPLQAAASLSSQAPH